MNDGQNATATEQTSAPAQTMADIASQVKTGDSGTSVPQQTQNEVGNQQPAQNNVSEFQSFVQESNKVNEELRQELQQLKQTQDEFVNAKHREAVNREIDSAAEQINKEAGADQDMARLFLEAQYRKDANFKKVWDNREENPEAYNEALKLLKPEWEAKNDKKIDSQIAENQRALQESQRSGSTIQRESQDDIMDKMSDAELTAHIRNIARN